MSQVATDVPASASKPWLNRCQWAWLAFQVVAVVPVIVAARRLNQDHFSLLWHDPAGIKLAVWAGFLLVADVLLFAGCCVLLNRLTTPAQTIVRTVIMTTAGVIFFFVLYLPALFVLLYGPATVAIQRNLSM